MSLSKVNTQFKNYGQYIFNNQATDFTTIKTDIFDGTLDAEGKANVMLKVPTATEAPGMLNATFTTRVFEPGGDASIYTQTIPFSPFTFDKDISTLAFSLEAVAPVSQVEVSGA